MAVIGMNEITSNSTGYVNINNTTKKNTVKSNFENHISNAVNSTMKTTNIPSRLVIHGIFGETDSNGNTVVGAWGDPQTGTSTTVYKPADFDKNNPIYFIKIWVTKQLQ